MAPDHMLQLCRFLHEIEPARLSRATVDHAKLVLIDTVGVVVAGAGVEEIDRLVINLNGGGSACCLGRRETFDPLNAALVMGMAGSNQEYEEGNSRAMGHPAIQIIPALVSETAATGSNGPTFLKALIGGYEAACRVSRAAALRRGLHPTGTWGVIGAALAVGLLRKRSPQELCRLADIAASYALSPYVKNSFVGRNVSCTFAGLVNTLGLMSNRFLDSGIEADPGCFEMTFSRFVSESLDPSKMAAGLGDGYAICENYFKPLPTCRFTHPGIEALKSLLNRHTIDPREIKRIKLTSFKAAVHVGGGIPANLEALRFSLPYLLAILLIHGDIDREVLSEDRVHEAAVRDLAAKVDLVLSPEYESMRPGRNAAHVAIELSDGRVLGQELLDCPGDPLNPLPAEFIHRKFSELVIPAVGRPRADEFMARVDRLEDEADLRPLFALLRPSA